MLDAIEEAARALPGDGWTNRIADEQPKGAAEEFLTLVRRQVYARATDARSPYGLECEAGPPVEGLIEAADALDRALRRMVQPMLGLRGELLARLDRSEEHTSELQSLMRISYAVFCLQKKNKIN